MPVWAALPSAVETVGWSETLLSEERPHRLGEVPAGKGRSGENRPQGQGLSAGPGGGEGGRVLQLVMGSEAVGPGRGRPCPASPSGLR